MKSLLKSSLLLLSLALVSCAHHGSCCKDGQCSMKTEKACCEGGQCSMKKEEMKK